MRAGLLLATLFWVSLFAYHSYGNSWGISLLLSFSAMVAGALVAFGVAEAYGRHQHKKKG